MDTAGARQFLAAPGMDSRIWVAEGVVDALYLDATGLYVDVTIPAAEQPDGIPVRAKLCSTFGGKGRAVHVPVKVKDQVLVLFPDGNMDGTPKAYGPLHNDEDEVPAEVLDDPDNLWIVAAEGEDVNVKTSGAGNVTIESEGTVAVKCDDVLLGNDADAALAKWPAVKSFLTTLLSGMSTAKAGGDNVIWGPLPSVPPDPTGGTTKVKAK